MSTKKTTKPQRKPRQQRQNENKQGKQYKTRSERRGNGPNSFMKEVGSRGADPRNSAVETADSKTMTFRDQSFSIVSSPQLVQQSYWTPLLAVISNAYSRGFAASSYQNNDPNAPYYAFVYLVKTLESAIQGGTPMLTDAPLWFVLLYQALRPGKTTFRTGSISYKFIVNEGGPYPFGGDPAPIIPWNAGDTAWAFGSIQSSSVEVNGFMQIIAPPGYTPELGEQSYANLIQYFANNGEFPMWKLVNLTEPIFRNFDASAYSAVYPEVGLCLGSTCGMVNETFSEVFINSPILAVFSAWEQNIFRSFSHTHQFGGGGCYLGGRICEFTKPLEIRNKVRPIFKMIDFNEIYEVMALWVAEVMSLASTNTNQAEGVVPLIVPMTVQEFRILLRQAILSVFQTSQALSFDQVFSGIDQFYPFLVSTGTCGKDLGNPMLMPIILVENIRAWIRRTLRTGQKANVPVSKRAPVQGALSVIDFVPVIGMWGSDIPLVSNYTYTVGTNEFPVFGTNAMETPINLIDGSYLSTSPPSQAYLDLNGGQLSDLLTSWNSFISTLTANSCTLSSLGGEKGIAALEVLTMSYVSIKALPPVNPLPIASPVVARANRMSTEKPRILGAKSVRPKAVRGGAPVLGVSASPYSAWTPNFVCSNQKVVANAWTECQTYWILPGTRTTGILNDMQNNYAYQSEVCEPNSFFTGPSGVGDNIPNADTMYLHHLRYAAMMTNPAAGRSNTLEDFMNTMAAQGRGGFLGKLAGGFLGGLVGMPGLGETIGDEIF